MNGDRVLPQNLWHCNILGKEKDLVLFGILTCLAGLYAFLVFDLAETISPMAPRQWFEGMKFLPGLYRRKDR